MRAVPVENIHARTTALRAGAGWEVEALPGRLEREGLRQALGGRRRDPGADLSGSTAGHPWWLRRKGAAVFRCISFIVRPVRCRTLCAPARVTICRCESISADAELCAPAERVGHLIFKHPVTQQRVAVLGTRGTP